MDLKTSQQVQRVYFFTLDSPFVSSPLCHDLYNYIKMNRCRIGLVLASPVQGY